MTQEVMVIMASESEVKKSSSGLPLSPSLARETPSTIAKVIRPRMFGPLVHSPEEGNVNCEAIIFTSHL